eukprot:7255751-Karenia_brevis.AAC.1
MLMPITDGQWFLFHKANGTQVWLCPVCGGIFEAGNSPVRVGMKVDSSTQDVLLVKAVAPGHKEL